MSDTTQSTENDARLANVCCNHVTCQREVREAMARAWDEAQERIAFHLQASVSYVAAGAARRIRNPYRVIPPERTDTTTEGSEG